MKRDLKHWFSNADGILTRFRYFGDDKQDSFLRGYAFGFYTGRQRGTDEDTLPFGADFKRKQT